MSKRLTIFFKYQNTNVTIVLFRRYVFFVCSCTLKNNYHTILIFTFKRKLPYSSVYEMSLHVISIVVLKESVSFVYPSTLLC